MLHIGFELARSDPSIIVGLTEPREANLSNLRKDAWVSKLLENWCSEMPAILRQDARTAHLAQEGELDVWEDPDTMHLFLLFLANVCRYSHSSLEDVIVPSLKRQYLRAHQKTMSPIMIDSMKTTLREIKRTPRQARESESGTGERERKKSKSPALISDVERIVSLIPDTRADKAAEASLYLFAVSVGARALTCENVLLKDILHVIRQSDHVLVQIRLRVTKGNANWDHIVTVEGNHHHATPSNLIYWLAQHLRAKFNLDLFHDDLSQDARRLWGWSRNAMRERFKTSFLKAGYPELIFGFHSLRAGFICSALLKANSSAMRTAVLEVTAFVGGWVAGGRAQLRYVKRAAKSCIVASRLVNPSSDQLSDDPVDLRLMAPELFHGVPLQPSQWRHTDLYLDFSKSLRGQIKDKITALDIPLSPPNLILMIDNVQEKAYNAFVQATDQLESQAKAIYTLNPRWHIVKQRCSEEQRARLPIAKAHLASMLTTDTFADLMAVLLSLIDPAYILKRATHLESRVIPSASPHKPNTPERPRLLQGQRKRVRWSKYEDRILLEGKEEHDETWVQIASKLPQRSNVDCKDRFHNILNQRKKQRLPTTAP
jgi:hypothetical protein